MSPFLPTRFGLIHFREQCNDLLHHCQPNFAQGVYFYSVFYLSYATYLFFAAFALAHFPKGEVEASFAVPFFTPHPPLGSSTTEVLQTLHQLVNLGEGVLLSRPARIRKSTDAPHLGLRQILQQLPE